MKKLLAVLLCVTVMATAFIACSKNAEENNTTTTQLPATEATEEATKQTTNTTAAPSENSTEDEATTEATTKKQLPKDDSPISVNEALNYLEDFYGKPFSVNATVKEDGIQYFKIIDKDGNLYARVSIDLENSKMTETIVNTNEINEYTIK